MNKVLLNTVHLDDAPIIKKGSGGGGVTINNQEKSLEITENGVTEVAPDSGFTGLSKVVVNTNVASSGGGSDMPVIGDGKTYLYIKIAAKGRMNVPLYFSQTVANGVTIDWGDGSATQTLSGTGKVNTAHTYAEVGDYVISLDPADGCTLGLEGTTSLYCVMGSTKDRGRVYCNMLQAVEIGRNVTSISDYAFSYCHSLSKIVIPNSVTIIGNNAFNLCYSLSKIVIPNSVTRIGHYAFAGCNSLTSIVIPNSITSIDVSVFASCSTLSNVVIPNSVTIIGNKVFQECRALSNVVIPNSVTSVSDNAFLSCYGMAFYDFSQATAVPSLGTGVFTNIQSDCKIIVPDGLYDEWIAATNWSSYASYIIKKSDWDASQS